jgi:hypothetical protein
VTAAGAAAALEHTAASASAATVHVVIHTALQSAPPALAGLTGLLSRVVSLTKAQKALLGLTLVTLPLIWHWGATPQAESVPVRSVDTPSPVAATFRPAAVAMPATPPVGTIETSPLPAVVAVVVPLKMEPQDAIRLTGLINLADCRVALLDIYFRTGLRSNDLVRTNHWILKEGESFEQDPFKGGRLQFELRHMNFDKGQIQARENGQDTEIGAAEPDDSWFSSANLSHGKPTMGLRGANFCDVLDLYGAFLGRTILCHPDVKPAPLDLVTSAGDRSAAARVIQRALKERGIGTMPLGARFELVAPADKVRYIMQRAGAPLASEDTDETVQAGVIRLDNVPWREVLGLYADLTGSRWQGNNPPTGNLVFLHNQTPLTKAEILYAFDTLLSWQGYKAKPIDEKSFRLVRVQKP